MRKRLGLYLFVLLVPMAIWRIGVLETHGLYPGHFTAVNDPMKAIEGLPIRKRIQDVYFQTSDHVRLNAWFIPPQKGKPTVVFAHGNGGNIGERWGVMDAFADRGYGVLTFDYRGYGKSQGFPTEQGLYKDMAAASDYLVKRGIPIQSQIAVGGSLGSGVAVESALHRRYRGLVLFSAYTSTPDVATHLRDTLVPAWLRFIPPKLIMRQHFNSLAKIPRIQCPTLIMQGQKDAMMPVSMAKALFSASKAPQKKLLIISNASHNTVFNDGESQLFQSIRDIMP